VTSPIRLARPPARRTSIPGAVYRWGGRILGLLLSVLLLAAFMLAGMVWATLPPAEESLTLAGLDAPVSITLDEAGVPRIVAQSERDAAMALGVLHARDRMMQMELMRRGASGRLAEIVGPAALRTDRFVRTLGLAQRAAADAAALTDDTRALLEAYAAGVNAWIDARGRLAAPEFLILGPPEPWQPADSLLWGRVMGVWLSGDWRRELARERLAAAGLPEARIAELWPRDDSPGRPDAALPEAREASLGADVVDRLAAVLARFPDDPGTLPDSASNAWAVASGGSATGAPLLASDPHLDFQAPILWYLVRIDLPDGRMRAGATSPGVPLIVIGRNERVAWGFTTTHSDTQDLFVEKLAGADAYLTPDGPRPFQVREEAILVRGRDTPERLLVRETRHGPVLSDLDETLRAEPGTVVAGAMANLAGGPDTGAEGLLALNRARGLDDVRAAATLISSPPQNLMAADAAGRIGLFLTGRTPLRRAGDGSRPARGWDGSQDWLGFVPFDDLPHVVDPASGVLVNANNRVAPDGGVFLGREWPGDWRFRRIGQMLADRTVQDPAGFGAMQRDVTSLLAQELLAAPDAVLRQVARPAGPAGTALDLLLVWDGSAGPDRPEPLIFAAWREAVLALAMAQAGVPPRAGPGAGAPEFLQYLLRPDGAGAWWCGGDCAAMAGRALEQAVAGLIEAHGADPAAWRWSAAHVARFEHPVLRFVPILGPLLRLEAATGGDGETVSRGGYRGGSGADAQRFAHVHGAGLRLVADLADPDATWAIIASGQSGHFLSAHWGDLLPAWRDGETLRLGRQPMSVRGRMTLVP
jgi:penicillin amidase